MYSVITGVLVEAYVVRPVFCDTSVLSEGNEPYMNPTVEYAWQCVSATAVLCVVLWLSSVTGATAGNISLISLYLKFCIPVEPIKFCWRGHLQGYHRHQIPPFWLHQPMIPIFHWVSRVWVIRGWQIISRTVSYIGFGMTWCFQDIPGIENDAFTYCGFLGFISLWTLFVFISLWAWRFY